MVVPHLLGFVPERSFVVLGLARQQPLGHHGAGRPPARRPVGRGARAGAGGVDLLDGGAAPGGRRGRDRRALPARRGRPLVRRARRRAAPPRAGRAARGAARLREVRGPRHGLRRRRPGAVLPVREPRLLPPRGQCAGPVRGPADPGDDGRAGVGAAGQQEGGRRGAGRTGGGRRVPRRGAARPRRSAGPAVVRRRAGRGGVPARGGPLGPQQGRAHQAVHEARRHRRAARGRHPPARLPAAGARRGMRPTRARGRPRDPGRGGALRPGAGGRPAGRGAGGGCVARR